MDPPHRCQCTMTDLFRQKPDLTAEFTSSKEAVLPVIQGGSARMIRFTVISPVPPGYSLDPPDNTYLDPFPVQYRPLFHVQFKIGRSS